MYDIDPVTGEPINPMVQPPQQGDFLNSPGMAMASQGINNMMALRRGQVPQVTPTQAYQRAVAYNSNLRMRQEQQQQMEKQRQHQRMISGNADQRAQAKAERDADPMFEYEQFKERYPEQAKDITFPEFMRLGFRGTAQPSAIREYERIYGPITGPLNEEERANYLDLKRGGMGYDLPGGGEAYRGAGGRTEELVSTEEAIAGDSAAAGGKRAAEKGADYSAKQVDTSTDNLYGLQHQYELADKMARESQKWLDMVESGEVDTGIVNQFLMDVFKVGTAELAAMDAKAIAKTLDNLQIVNLAPVTVTELQKIAKLWANIGNDEEVNRGVLKQAVEDSIALQRKLRSRARKEGGRLKKYGGGDEYDFMKSELPDLFPVKPQEPEDDGGGWETINGMRVRVKPGAN